MRSWLPITTMFLMLIAIGHVSADEVEIEDKSSPFKLVSHPESTSDPLAIESDPIADANATDPFAVDFKFIADQPEYFTVHEAKAPIFGGLIIGAAFLFYWRRQRNQSDSPNQSAA